MANATTEQTDLGLDGEVVWRPSPERAARTRIADYLRWLREARGLTFTTYHELWQWSVSDLVGFWSSLWDYFAVNAHSPYETVLVDDRMPGTQWFTGSTLNYAEQSLAGDESATAVVYRREDGVSEELTYGQLRDRVAAVAAGLRALGVGRGDRVVALAPNCPQTLVVFLATASIGAIWSSCAPEFGITSVVDRFRQIEPTVLVAVDGYVYNGRTFDCVDRIERVRAALPTLTHTVVIPYVDPAVEDRVASTVPWSSLLAAGGEAAVPLTFEAVPFDHPLWILYSSGTTGLPKPIVQGHGGILLEHLKTMALHLDLSVGDRFFWYSTTGWMMWNFLIGGLLVSATIVLFDGNPAYPDLDTLWALAEETGVTYFGTSAPHLHNCMKAGLRPGIAHDLSAVRTIGSTGAPLAPEAYRWVLDAVGPDVMVASSSGGTDVCTAFLASCPLLPVIAGELQCRTLGAAVAAFDEYGRPVVDAVGELVVTEPMPSMPLYLWGDSDGSRLHHSYFDMYPGVWRHGDWVKLTPRGSSVVYGRSDATLNRGGVRMGTSDFYRAVEVFPEVADSLIVDTSELGRDGELLLFVVPAAGATVDDRLVAQVRTSIRDNLSPRHVPDRIIAVPALPRTLNGKKLEVPVKRILAGRPVAEAVSADALADPDALHAFLDAVRPLTS